jgi:hypothetical protein
VGHNIYFDDKRKNCFHEEYDYEICGKQDDSMCLLGLLEQLDKRNCCNCCKKCPPGPKRPQGAQGNTGTACGLSEFAYIYDVSGQSVAQDATVLFATNGVISAGITHAEPSDSII